MVRRAMSCLAALILLWFPSSVYSQTTATYHLHNASSLVHGGTRQLTTSTASPPSVVIQSSNFKNAIAGNTDYTIAKFETQAMDPNLGGTIPAQSVVTFKVWMRKTAQYGTFRPRAKFFLNNYCCSDGVGVCSTSGYGDPSQPADLTQTLTVYTIQCTAQSPIAMSSSDRFFVEIDVYIAGAPGNHNIFCEFAIEGSPTPGQYDSTVVVPLPQPASITPPLAPNRGPNNTLVHIVGNNFRDTQGTSAVTFNGMPAAVTSWSATAINARVPLSATATELSATVRVMVGGTQSGGVAFTVTPPPSISGLNPPGAAVGQSVTISGVYFLASQLDGASTLTLNGTPITPTSWTDSSIGFTVPLGAASGPVAVNVSGNASTGTFTLITTGTIAGSVTRSTGGSAISGATVQAVLTGIVKGSATAAANGTYAIPNLDPGTYDVRVSATGFSSELRSATNVAANVTTTVDVALYQPGSISGTVTQAIGGAAIPGAAIVMYAGPLQKGSAATDSNGNYSIANLRPGAYTVQATNVGNRTKEQGATITENASTTSNLALDPVGTGPVQYVYDELNRLVSVVDPSGDAAHYNYDKVGNILSIARAGANSVSISEFTPNSGPIGSSVTVYGTGFSTTSSNTVTFGAGQAAATVATPNQLTVTVPPNASSSSIGVSNTTGSANSAGTFTVVSSAATGAPTISGFAPPIVPQGAAVTVNGTNFDTVAANDRLTVNAMFTGISTASATSLTATVPATATSGPITVATQSGTASTSTDLFVAPAPHAASDVEVAERIAISEANKNVIIASAGHIALYTFPGVQGQRVALLGYGATANVLGCDINASILMPSGGSLGVAPQTCMEQIGFIDASVLPASGIYSVYVEPVAPTHSADPDRPPVLTFTLYNVPADDTGTIAVDGPPVTVTTALGQNALRTFSGSAGQRVSVAGTNGMDSQVAISCDVLTSIVTANGTEVGFPTCMETSGFLDTVTLPATGTYSVFVNPQAWAFGSLTLNLYTVLADFTDTIAINGSPVTVTTTTPGQNGTLTFSGSANQAITVHGTNPTGFNVSLYCDLNVSVVTADGTLVAEPTCMDTGGTLSTTLPTAGSYKVVIDPVGAPTGSIAISISSP